MYIIIIMIIIIVVVVVVVATAHSNTTCLSQQHEVREGFKDKKGCAGLALFDIGGTSQFLVCISR